MGQSYLPQVLNALSVHLTYQWIIATLLGQRRTLIQPRRVCVGYKPLLWFVKGSYRDQAGKPSFNALQNYRSSEANLIYYIFDLRVLAGHDVMTEPLTKRRVLLVRRQRMW
jgi:hypothetical protein